jgi:hypothetical protein
LFEIDRLLNPPSKPNGGGGKRIVNRVDVQVQVRNTAKHETKRNDCQIGKKRAEKKKKILEEKRA